MADVTAGAVARPAGFQHPVAMRRGGVADGKQQHFEWVGSVWGLARIAMLNAFLTLLTVGVYNFWGRTEIRRRTWSSIHFLGDPLVYHGTGRELFTGFMTVFAVVLLPILLIGTAMVIYFGQASFAWGLYQAGLFLVVYPLLKAIANYRGRRYRLSRTSWRGIKGRMRGSSSSFAIVSWFTALLYPLTLGWIGPWRQVYLQRRIANETTFGDHRLVNTATSGRVYLPFAVLWIGTFVLYFGIFFAAGAGLGGEKLVLLRNQFAWRTLTARDITILLGIVFGALFVWSLMSAFYRATLYNQLAKHTFLVAPHRVTTGAVPSVPLVRDDREAPSPLRFRLKVRGPALIYLFVTNVLITYGSLFVLKPVATARSMRYFVEHLELDGPFDPATLRRDGDGGAEGGEGLAQAFDLDAF